MRGRYVDYNSRRILHKSAPVGRELKFVEWELGKPFQPTEVIPVIF